MLMTPPHSIEFAFIARDSIASLASGVGASEVAKHLERASALLHGILTGLSDADVAKNLQERLGEVGAPLEVNTAAAEELKAETAFIRAELGTLIPALQKRYEIKRSSKAASFRNVDWDIKVKVDDAIQQVHRFPYATIRLRYQTDFSGDPWALIAGRGFDSVQVNFNSDEIVYLKQVLDRVLDSLRLHEQDCAEGDL